MNELNSFLPEHAVTYAKELLLQSNAVLKIVRGRRSKYGDYRPGNKLHPQRISVNGDLNKYAFLITLIHELAHAYAFDKHGQRIKPHGKEWKAVFKQLMEPLLNTTVFPEDVFAHLHRHMTNPKASTSADIALLRCLKKYDPFSEKVYLEDIPNGTVFQLSSGRAFVKGERKRKNFLCLALHTKRKYLINPMAEVKPY